QEMGLPFSSQIVPTGMFSFAPTKENYTIPEVIDILNEALAQQKYRLIRRDWSFTVVPSDEPIDLSALPRVTVDELKDRGTTEMVMVAFTLPPTLSAE